MDGFLNALGQVISPQGAFLILLLGAIFWYVRFLKRTSANARLAMADDTQQPRSEGMNETELERYARHIVLREIGGQGQTRLRNSRVLVVGAGGLGAPVLSYLAAAGVGTIGVVDDDVVSLSNLQRQVLFDEDQLGMPKVFAAQAKLKKLNPYVDVLPFHRRLTKEDAQDLFVDFDLILDGTDNFETRYMINAVAVQLSKPLLSGAISQWEGQVSLFQADKDQACYACIFPKEPADGLAPNCAEAGVMGALPGIIGSIMAAEAIKYITGAGQVLRSEMLIFDALYGETRKMKLKKSVNCSVCEEK